MDTRRRHEETCGMRVEAAQSPRPASPLPTLIRAKCKCGARVVIARGAYGQRVVLNPKKSDLGEYIFIQRTAVRAVPVPVEVAPKFEHHVCEHVSPVERRTSRSAFCDFYDRLRFRRAERSTPSERDWPLPRSDVYVDRFDPLPVPCAPQQPCTVSGVFAAKREGASVPHSRGCRRTGN